MTTDPSTVHEFSLTNIHCASCVKSIENIFAQKERINAKVNFANRSLTVTGNMKPTMVISLLKQRGYEAHLKNQNSEQQNLDSERANVLYFKALIAGIWGLLLLALCWSPWMPLLTHFQGQIAWLVIGLITLFVMIYSGHHIYRNAWSALKHRLTTMNTLISLGSISAWIYSMIIVIFPTITLDNQHNIYFEATVIIIALINLGVALEMKTQKKTNQAINKLIALQPKTVRKLMANGQECDVAIEDVQLGDRLRAYPGEKIAVDGQIIEGESMIDESMLTGEAMPQVKKQHDDVFAGTINGQGSFIYQAKKIGNDTKLGQIINLVKQAQNTKPAIARLADQIATYFVPAVILIAILTAVIWFISGAQVPLIFVTTMSVLIIACPCALGLAAPISVIAGIGKAAEYGILIRNATALQLASKIDVLLIDKTGTITTGKPQVVCCIPLLDSISKTTLLSYAASVEKKSEHPLGHAIMEAAKLENLNLPSCNNFLSLTGRGVQATIADSTILLGNQTLMLEHNILIDDSITALKNNPDVHKQQTTIFVAIDGKLAGIIGIFDPPRTDSKKAIALLKQKKISVIMVTGDQKTTAESIGKEVGIETVIAELLPNEKAEEIHRLQQKNLVVAMVGDGINDAPALTQADVGFAIGSGTDIAIESGDVILTQNSMTDIATAINISKTTIRNIKQNMFLAFMYNSLSIPIAAGILYPLIGLLLNPIIAGAAMSLSSLMVVMNATRLRLHKF